MTSHFVKQIVESTAFFRCWTTSFSPCSLESHRHETCVGKEGFAHVTGLVNYLLDASLPDLTAQSQTVTPELKGGDGNTFKAHGEKKAPAQIKAQEALAHMQCLLCLFVLWFCPLPITVIEAEGNHHSVISFVNQRIFPCPHSNVGETKRGRRKKKGREGQLDSYPPSVDVLCLPLLTWPPVFTAIVKVPA